MSSREIAEVVDSRHDKVKQSIERLVQRRVIVKPPMGDEQEVATPPTGGHRKYTISVYYLSKRDSYVVVAQLSPEFTARLRVLVKVKEILRKYGYPSDFEDAAVRAVLALAEAILNSL